MLTVTRYHDISAGHRVVGHENKCRHLHGHNYRVHFTLSAPQLDQLGRVMDFGFIKELLCEWLEQTWDHKMLMWKDDPMLEAMRDFLEGFETDFRQGLCAVSFNPTAENMARYLGETVGPAVLRGTGCTLVFVKIEETAKCSATWIHDTYPDGIGDPQ